MHGDGDARDDASGFELLDVEVADAQQQIVKSVFGLDLVLLVEMLELTFDRNDCIRVEQLAKLGIAEELTQLRLIYRQRLGPPLGQRRVAVIDVVSDIAEQKRGRERRWNSGIDRRDSQRASADLLEGVDERRHIEV